MDTYLGKSFYGEITRLEVIRRAVNFAEVNADIQTSYCFGAIADPDCVQGFWNYMLQPGTYLQIPSGLQERPCEQGLSTINCPAPKGTIIKEFIT